LGIERRDEINLGARGREKVLNCWYFYLGVDGRGQGTKWERNKVGWGGGKSGDGTHSKGIVVMFVFME